MCRVWILNNLRLLNQGFQIAELRDSPWSSITEYKAFVLVLIFVGASLLAIARVVVHMPSLAGKLPQKQRQPCPL